MQLHPFKAMTTQSREQPTRNRGHPPISYKPFTDKFLGRANAFRAYIKHPRRYLQRVAPSFIDKKTKFTTHISAITYDIKARIEPPNTFTRNTESTKSKPNDYRPLPGDYQEEKSRSSRNPKPPGTHQTSIH